MVVIAIIALLAVLALVAAFLGAKYWHWAHVLVVVALFFSTVGFAFLAADVIRVRAKHMKRAQDSQAKIEPLQDLSLALSRGTDKPDMIRRLQNEEVNLDDDVERLEGVVNLRHRLQLANRRLGRVWRDAQPMGPPNRQTGQVTIGIEFPQPLGMNEGAIVFGFEQGPPKTANAPQGRQYLGEFRVLSVAGQQVTLEPVLALDAFEAQRFLGSQGPWAFYETMPVDRHDIFEPLANERLQALLPADSAEEYVRDGSPWTVDDGEWVKEGRDEKGLIVEPSKWDDTTKFFYRRRLRDYAFLFNDYAKTRIELEARRQALEEDTAKINAAIKLAEKLNAYKLEMQAKLEHDLDGVTKDREAVEAHLAALENIVAQGQRLRDRLTAENNQLAADLVRRQQELAGGVEFSKQPVPSRGAVDVDAL